MGPLPWLSIYVLTSLILLSMVVSLNFLNHRICLYHPFSLSSTWSGWGW